MVSIVVALIGIVGGSAAAALINQIGESKRQKKNREYAAEDTETATEKAMKQGMKLLLADKLQYLGLKYIEDGEITFQDRKMLCEMHQCYHQGLGGNGDFDALMDEIKELPLKVVK